MRAALAAGADAREASLPAPTADPAEAGPTRETRDTLLRWSGVACLYAGTAAALACLWSPV